MATIRIELDIEVEAWPIERVATESGMSVEDFEDDENTIEPGAIGDCLANHLSLEEYSGEALAGSCLFVTIGDVSCVRADLVREAA